MRESMFYCQACLSDDRKLHPLADLQSLLQDISFWELSSNEGGICWECRQRMKSFAQFKIQVTQAQQLVLRSTTYNNEELLSLTKLSICNQTEENHIIFDYDTEINKDITEKTYKQEDQTKKCQNQENNKQENVQIKREINYLDDKYSDYEEQLFDEIEIFETKPTTSDIYVDIINFKDEKRVLRPSKKVKKKIKRVRKRAKESEEEVRQKFTEVEFTEEEMIRNREEKRNQPNFKKIPFKCDSCVLGFTRKDTYDAHVEKRHDRKNGLHMCPVCQSRFQTTKQADRHKKKHYKLYRCKLCKYETLELWSALSHCQTKHNNDDIENIHCRYCNFVGKTPEELSQHMSSEHSVYCKECGEKFKKITNLKAHMRRIHAVKREFICDLCSKTFKTKSRLESHMANHNSSLAQKLAYCALCKIQYKNIYVYRSHLRTSANHAQHTYQCVDCNKRFASKVYWKKHYNFYHLHKSQFRCEICSKLFISDWRLKNHRQTQHGQNRTRDHRCDQCGKLFFTSSTLKGHQLTHSTQRTFMCEDCGDTFKQRPALYTHCRLVHRGVKRRKVVT